MTVETRTRELASRTGWAAVARDVQVQRITPALHRQRWSLASAGPATMARVIQLQAGRGTVVHRQGETVLRASDVLWLPAGMAGELRVEAGSTGVLVGFSESLLAAALGEGSDADALRQVSLRLCRVTPPEGRGRDELTRSLLAVETELRDGGGALRPFLCAHLTLLLVGIWRLSSRETLPVVPHGAGGQRLLRFRHLVEAQYRTHWTVARYARELGLSADGLHDLCLRSLGRTPLSLVHQRVLSEACSLLAGTDVPVGQLALDLGFSGASAFSRFFKRGSGLSPVAWRTAARRSSGPVARTPSYADWP